MAISPIDLQTLFSQVDKIGKQENAQRQGAAIQQSLQQIHNQLQTEERIQEVNEAQNTGEGAEAVTDGRPRQREDEDRQKKEEEPGEEEAKKDKISDPDLGRNIDVLL
ncbi:MAG: hypothetical protein LBJ31_09845 [Treponema sp.]|jgi:hypothetical protein|nr:hypothetical protein [Treponema sp.]